MNLHLLVLDGELSVCRLAPDRNLNFGALEGPLVAAVRTEDELSVVCATASAPADAKCEGGWRALRVAGTLDFGLTGVLAAIAQPMADAGISIFAVSTYDTDYLLVKGEQLKAAITSLEAAGHTVG